MASSTTSSSPSRAMASPRKAKSRTIPLSPFSSFPLSPLLFSLCFPCLSAFPCSFFLLSSCLVLALAFPLSLSNTAQLFVSFSDPLFYVLLLSLSTNL